jgi:hypothetical protein
MPTTLTLIYNAYVQIRVPNEIAKKIQDGTYSSWNRHGDLYYADENNVVHKLSGTEGDADFKRAVDEEWGPAEPDPSVG